MPAPILGPSGWLCRDGNFWTDEGNGPNRRLRVDPGQTGFFAGREFRTFREFNIATGSSLVVKAEVPVNIILAGLVVDLISGSLRIESAVGGTPGGTFSESLPIFNRNNMTERPDPYYLPQVVLTAGGTITGQTPLDVLRVQTSGQGAQVGSVGAQNDDVRGIGPGTYWIMITASGNDPSVGVIRVRWEERP